jgi:hypothetical protein
MPRGVRTAWPWFLVSLFILACLRPVLGDWQESVLAPFGGLDARFQSALLEWSTRHLFHPDVWRDLPVFFPTNGAIAFMDPLTAQALLVKPLHAAQLLPAALYNWAILISLALAGVATAWLWRTTSGKTAAGGVMALLLIGAPYTLAHLGHLNQLPPPGVPAALAALVFALRRWERGGPSATGWWLLACALIAQAALGWYGFAFALLAVTVVFLGWCARRVRKLRWGLLVAAILPVMTVLVGVWLLAAPHLNIARQESDFTRHLSEVSWYSADVKHLMNLGAYRSGPDDWTGVAPEARIRHEGVDRQVLHPGWVALILAVAGFVTRGRMSVEQREWGRLLLLAGLAGMILAFGDSVGLPGTDKRALLPLGWLQTILEPARAYRAAWRFSFLFTLAVAWWGAMGWQRLAAVSGAKGRFMAHGVLVLLLLESLPVGVPTLTLDGQSLARPTPSRTEAVLTLPAPLNVYAEDHREARWLWRALHTGRPVTGGVTGWVPPRSRELRNTLAACEQGHGNVDELLSDLAGVGVTRVEMFADDDDSRLTYWRMVFRSAGGDSRTEDGVEIYDLPLLPDRDDPSSR